jgi:putative transcriptional regulator
VASTTTTPGESIRLDDDRPRPARRVSADGSDGSDCRAEPRPGRRSHVTDGARADLARRIAGEITLSDEPGATLRKWRTDFDVSQTTLADHLDVSSSVVSDYESGRRESPGIGVVSRMVNALLDIDEARGGSRIRQYARVVGAGFESDIVQDLREYPTAIRLPRVYEAMGATEVVRGDTDRVSGHTVIDSIEAITRLSSEEFYRLYGESTNRVLAFTNVTRGESPLVALRVVNPTPNAVVLHGLSEDDLWEHAATLATIDGFSLAVSTRELSEMLSELRALA